MYVEKNFVTCDSKGSSDNAIKFLRKFDLLEVLRVEVKRQSYENTTTAVFYFADGTVIKVNNGFAMGYTGVGPRGLFEILVECGVSVKEAMSVFRPELHEYVFEPMT